VSFMSVHFENIARIIDNALPVTEPQVHPHSGPVEPPRRSRRHSSVPPAINEPSQSSGSSRTPTPPTETTIDRKLARFPLTDLGNAERFVGRFGDRFKWCPAIGWLAWDGRRWSLDAAEGLLDRAVHEMIRAIKDEAAAIRGTKDDFQVVTPRGVLMRSEKVAAWCLTSQANAHITRVAKRAAPYLEVSTDELDADPFKINVANGTILIRRNIDDIDPISFKPHDPKDLITKISPVAYDPDALCHRWDTFLDEVQPTPADQRFLHQWMGYSLTGDVSEQRLVVYHGHGSNGKSTTNEVCAYIAGDYGASVAIETFLDQGRTRRGGEPTPDLARLQACGSFGHQSPKRGQSSRKR
jgi:putative DNA primase/helicase